MYYIIRHSEKNVLASCWQGNLKELPACEIVINQCKMNRLHNQGDGKACEILHFIFERIKSSPWKNEDRSIICEQIETCNENGLKLAGWAWRLRTDWSVNVRPLILSGNGIMMLYMYMLTNSSHWLNYPSRLSFTCMNASNNHSGANG